MPSKANGKPTVFSPIDLQKQLEKFKSPDDAVDYNGFKPPDIPWDKLVRQHRQRLPSYARELLRKKSVPKGTRSDEMYALGCALIESGVPFDHAFVLLRGLPWNKFREGRSDEFPRIFEILEKARRREVAERKKPKTKLKGKWGENLFDLMREDLPEPEFLVQDIWPARGWGMVAGEAKTHKTWLVLDLAISVATGTPFLGKFGVNDPGPVLFVEAEVRRNSMAFRTAVISGSRPVWGHADVEDGAISAYFNKPHPLILSNNRGVDLSEEGYIKQLGKQIDRTGAKMLVLDPLQNMMGPLNENSAGDMRQILLPLTHTCQKRECALVVVHHFSKAPSDPRSAKRRPGQRASGSQFFHGWAEAGLWIDHVNDDTIIVEREFRDFDPHGPLMVEFAVFEDEDGWNYDTLVSELEANRSMRASSKPGSLDRLVFENPGISLREATEKLEAKSPKTILKRAQDSKLIEAKRGKASVRGGRRPIVLVPKNEED